MSNPASLLLDILTTWKDPGTSSARAARNDDFLEQHMHAVRLLIEIEHALDRLDRIGRSTRVSREALISWRRIIFNYPDNWTGAHTGDIDQTALNFLELTAELIANVCPPIQETALHKLGEYLDLVATTINNDEHLPSRIKLSVLSVVDSLRNCVDNLTVSSAFHIADELHRLLGALLVAMMQHKDKDSRQRYADLIQQGATGYLINQMPALGPALETLKALIPGS